MSHMGHLLDLLKQSVRTLGQAPARRRRITPAEEYRRSVESFVHEVTGQRPTDWRTFAQALTHSSYVGSNGGEAK